MSPDLRVSRGSCELSDDDRMLHLAHASRHHWGEVVGSTDLGQGGPANLARGEWLCSRVYAVLGRAEPARHHAERLLMADLETIPR